MSAYYNEIDKNAAQWIRNLIRDKQIPDGEVDTRSIELIQPDELRGFTQVHCFAGIAGWGIALRIAKWPDDRPIWTGSCPCQPFSIAGKGAGSDDPRHLWPHFHRLISTCRPAVVMGEQVASAAAKIWLDGVSADLKDDNYSCRSIDIPACGVGAPHIRNRLWWIAERDGILNGRVSNSVRSEWWQTPQGGGNEHDRRNTGRPQAASGSGLCGAPDHRIPDA